MSSFKIVSVPTDQHGETNTVYVNPAEGLKDGSFIDIGGFVFTVTVDAQIEAGTLAMNLMQRRCAKVSTTAGDRAVAPAPGWAPPVADLARLLGGAALSTSALLVLGCGARRPSSVATGNPSWSRNNTLGTLRAWPPSTALGL